MTDNEKLKIVADKATAILFLNQQWIQTLADELERNNLLTPSLSGLVNHAKSENRTTFNEIVELEK